MFFVDSPIHIIGGQDTDYTRFITAKFVSKKLNVRYVYSNSPVELSLYGNVELKSAVALPPPMIIILSLLEKEIRYMQTK